MTTGRLTTRRQGDRGEASALEWLTSKGAAVLVPFGSAPDYDLIADWGDTPVRVQVKTSTCFAKGRWAVTLATRGGNQSWNGLVKRFSPTRCDLLFVLVGDGRRWCIPADRVEATSGLHLGGPKYAEFEVEPGLPLPTAVAA
ncbi:group I intron-associated PD-(D/E)XK endonuclease [Conexibacter sp. SYSU D00693]|uniref:group I intron-associated PD-(D/E)XK endonuclease n=1 Tax=Conexibacter sp. SYSU D00693 TaxID=2812560 RepID=UPI001F11FFAE|nr:group I intron-associated PD-(D/E)XK endonuclease [Conexibacter sp. SYSU D00693]